MPPRGMTLLSHELFKPDQEVIIKTSVNGSELDFDFTGKKRCKLIDIKNPLPELEFVFL